MVDLCRLVLRLDVRRRGKRIARPGASFCGVRVMRAGKTVSEESLQRLWSEIALLPQEVEQAQRDQKTASQVQLASAV